MKIKTNDNINDVMIRAGYAYHFTERDGWIRYYSKKRRFHLYVEGDNYGSMHIDITVNGRHKCLRSISSINKERKRIKTFDSKPIPQKRNPEDEWLPNWKEITKRKVIKRQWFNPLRYCLGKFKYIKNETL